MDVSRTSVCRECLSALRRAKKGVAHTSPTSGLWAQTRRTFIKDQQSPRAPAPWPRVFYTSRAIQARWTSVSSSSSTGQPTTGRPTTSRDLQAIHTRIQELSDTVLKPSGMAVPTEQRVLYVLEQQEALAKVLLDEQPYMPPRPSQEKHNSATATSALLGSVNIQQRPAHVDRSSLLGLISEKAEAIARHPDVFLTPAILSSYVGLQVRLSQPSSFPDIFDLYARKPVPTVVSGRIEHNTSNPDKVNTAIDSNTAHAALGLAMELRSLPLCIDIINTTFCTTSYKRSKVIRQALVPGVGLALAPLAAYTVASQFASFQSTMDPSYASGIAFTGIMAYVGAVSMVGYVAVTTANDQMDRVTWAQGVPLWERWIREEERAALDRVAGKWGFSNPEKRGDEEGQDWESLREFIGLRGMVLDKVELMEGME